MTTNHFDKLVTLLKELFQLDKPELDFGFYRIMHARSAEVTLFLEEELLPQVRSALNEYGSAERIQVEAELAKTIDQLKAAGVDPESAPKVRDLRVKLNADDDLAAIEADVYDHLYRFFRRYYKDGDFISQRVYKDGVYALPYQGEEVKLHWANADQYYIKTDEYLRNYSFRLRPNAENGSDPMRVHLRLVDAAEGEHDNVKPAASSARVFVLAEDETASAVEEISGAEHRELLIRFEYRQATLDDWPSDQRAGRTKPPKQKSLLDGAEHRILARLRDSRSRWLAELEKPHEKAGGQPADYTRLRAHLNRYAARNAFDYFIHKDLGGFLRRELDFYIKNEVMRLDDIEHTDAPSVEQYLSKVRAIRRVAGEIINFLATLENFQKRLWLKKKFVVETSYCIRLGCIPADFLSEIAANEAQRREWVELCRIDAIKRRSGHARGYSEPLTVESLRSQPALMVDTRHFPPAFAERLIETSVNPPNSYLLVHGENFQSLNVLSRCFRGEINCVYIDPPYNAPASEILYKNNFKHSSFLSMIESRLLLSRHLTAIDGSHVVAIDKNERNGVFRVLSQTFPHHDNVAVTVEHNRKGVQDQKFSFTHEYALFSIPPARKTLNQVERREDRWTYDNFRNWGGESRREDGAKTFYAVRIRDGEILDFGDVWTDEGQHPEGANVPRLDGTIEVFPIDGEGVERKWRYERGTVDSIRHKLKVVKNRAGLWDIKIAKTRDQRKTVWYGAHYNAGDHGTKLLGDLGFPSGSFDNPKSVFNVQDCVDSVSDGDHLILDYFAGSGTTGHAVINLNRGDGGNRRFILVEMGEHFDTVLLPRLKKVIYSSEWKNGRPVQQAAGEESERSPDIMKVIRLESYEDTLNNLRVPTAEADSEDNQHLRPPPEFPREPLDRRHGGRSTSCATCSTSRRAAARRCWMLTSSSIRPPTYSTSRGRARTKAGQRLSILSRRSTGFSDCGSRGFGRRVSTRLTSSAMRKAGFGFGAGFASRRADVGGSGL
ncbi:MAG: site-specific DNA-methyltransferase [Holophagales bacterium]|nr:site-specific DNA-methyltransferase [Holophagales bacterium]